MIIEIARMLKDFSLQCCPKIPSAETQDQSQDLAITRITIYRGT